jgi:hypothetical protein
MFLQIKLYNIIKRSLQINGVLHKLIVLILRHFLLFMI